MPTRASASAAIDPDLLAVRKKRAGELFDAAEQARINAAIVERRRANAADPLDDDDEVTAATEEAASKLQQADFTINVAGLDAAAVKALKRERRKEIREQLKTQLASWKQLRKIHQDFIDNPDAYGGMDLGNAPLDPDQQKIIVAQYDSSIAAVEAELSKTPTEE